MIGLRRPGQRQRLREDQRKRLEDLPGWSWAHRQTRLWETYFDDLAAYAAAHGHASPSPGYVTAAGVDLGAWVHELRRPSRRAKLAHARQRRLESLPGWSWEYHARPTWDAAFAALATYAAAHGHTNPPCSQATDDGRSLAAWATAQRQARSKGKLSAERRRRLEGCRDGRGISPKPDGKRTSPPTTAAAIPAGLRVIERRQRRRLATGGAARRAGR